MSGLDDFADDGNDEDREPVLRMGEPVDDGDTVTITVDAEPEITDTDYGDALRVAVTFEESTVAFEDEDGRAFERGQSVVLLSWSKRLARALKRARREADGETIVGETITVSKHGSGYETDFNARIVGGE
jgi:hypothetical protein